MAILAWIFGFIAIFMLIIVYFVFMPVLAEDIGDFIINQSANLSTSTEIQTQINTTMIAVPVAFLVLIVGVILYMVAATEKEDPSTDIF